MQDFFLGASLVILFAVLLCLYRVVKGPVIMDRIIGVNVIGTKTIVLLCLIGFLAGRPDMFLDIALAYALINFIATVAVLRYMERMHRLQEERSGAALEEGGAP